MPERSTIEEMQEIANARGGKCLSSEYINTKTKLKWECAEGHQWSAVPDSIKSGTWCAICSAKKQGQTLKLSIFEMQQIAADRGGKCLSSKYVNSTTKLKWECAEGHRWVATPGNIKVGKWCAICSAKSRGKKRRLSISEMQQIAADRGGKCLSSEYVNSTTKLKWECAEGHQWTTTPGNIKAGKWCAICSRLVGFDKQRSTIEEMQEIANARGGKCLSSEYINTKTKLKWECAEGHQWSAVPDSIKSGTWCAICSAKKQKRAT